LRLRSNEQQTVYETRGASLMSPSSTGLTIQLRCESREYKEQSRGDSCGEEDLHSTVVFGNNDVSKFAPDNDGRQQGYELQASAPPNTK